VTATSRGLLQAQQQQQQQVLLHSLQLGVLLQALLHLQGWSVYCWTLELHHLLLLKVLLGVQLQEGWVLRCYTIELLPGPHPAAAAACS
jgi:hypothetical protein